MKGKKIVSTLMACVVATGVLSIPALAAENPVPLAESVYAVGEEPVNAPVDKSQLGDLKSSTVETYMVDGFTVTDTIRTYEYNAIPMGTEYKEFKEVSRTITKNSTVYSTVTLDADFYYSPSDNTVRCPRYYSSYEIFKDIFKNPKEYDMATKSGTDIFNENIAYYTVTCKYSYTIGFTGTPYTFSMTVGCDAGGGDYKCKG